MGRPDGDAALEAAIVSAMQDEGMIPDGALLTGFTVVASFQREEGGSTLAYWVPTHQPTHHTVGMLQLVDQFVRERDYGV